ncbi:galactose oxidase [Streptomyces fagopyri]|uniref:Galactose oxidase n=1 Tax=Streptomyces fagopyri TaxID=2662397 RepID=A0A5Q0L5A3_9ACTN|nr:carboxypeptidase regulatory-like domain-containing protein [Streptomyces fagopyri]QFZ72121.1 galactose oxidase [Streptomyces fagopyri]
MAVTVLAVLMALLPQHAFAAAASAPEPAGVSAEAACGTPRPGSFTCFALRRTDVRAALGLRRAAVGQAAPDGYSPADLRAAYGLRADGGEGATIAIVDAYDNPGAEADLAVYRQQYGLPACTSGNGCFRKVDERGGTTYPAADDGWAGEISLDLDMVSAIAPNAHLLLVEADTASSDDLGAAENTAVSLGARYVSNSWGGYGDDASQLAYDEAYFNHPGVAVVFSSGDNGYGTSYPASSPYVTAVGGTSLVRDGSTRGWNESVWNATTIDGGGQQHWGAPGSGCSDVEPKPAFQATVDCAGRSVADVSAVADPATGVAVYNSFSDGGWNVYGGTSASAPIIAGVYALAGTPVAGTYPAAYPYQTSGALHDVTQGDDASCADRSVCGHGPTPECTPAFTCSAQPGYDGPSGLGTPDGTIAFRPGPHGTVSGSVTDAGTGRPVPGATVTLGAYRASTDAQGGYRLDVPAGAYPLTVSAFGYRDSDLGTVRVDDGATLAKSTALTGVPAQTLSGTVRDGGQHGWGVYARLTIDGVPGTFFTDPASGRYAVRVPEGRTYTLHATALYPGYRPAAITVPVRSAARTANLTLSLETTGTLPPGYEMTYHGGEAQHFATTATPEGWTVRNNTAAGGWQFDDPLNRGNQTGATGRFAEVDDFALGWAPADTELISPAYDFSAERAPELQFDTALPSLYRVGDLTADVDASTDGGATWTTLWHHTDIVAGPAHETVPLTRYAGKKSVRIRFHFTGSLTGIWQIDDVSVGTPVLVTRPGGLLVGRVDDANTGHGVLGASVAAAAVPADSGRMVASPGDPARGEGLYWLFSSHTGTRKFTAGLPGFGYPPVTGTARVRPDAVTTADFTLHPAQLRYDVPAVAANVPWGDSRSVTVTIHNTGGSPADVSLGEQRLGGPSASSAGAPARHTKAALTPNTLLHTAAGPASDPGSRAGQAWSALTDLPTGTFGGIAAVDGGTLYAGLGEAPGGQFSGAFSAYDPGTASWRTLTAPATKRLGPAYGFIRGKLYVTGGRDAAGAPIAGSEVYDPPTDTWSQIADAPKGYGAAGSVVLGDRLYVIGGCDRINCGTDDIQVYDPATDTWSAGAPYPEPISYPVCGAADGVAYCTGGAYEPNGHTPQDTDHTYALDPEAGTWHRVADAPADVWGATGTAADGQLLVAGGFEVSAGVLTNEAHTYDPATDTWSALPNLAEPVLGAQSAPGWFAVGGMDAYSVPQSAVRELPGWDQAHGDVPWIAESARKLTVKAHGSARIRLTLDAGAMTAADARTHRAALVVDTDTPYGAVSLPVTMTVVPPAGWGRLTGTVTGRTSGGTAAPLGGAAVEVDGANGAMTVATALDGTYSAWLAVKGGPVRVVVSAAGYRPVTRPVRLVKGGAVTSDFRLRSR